MKNRPVPTTLHDLVQITAEALHERADYIADHADLIPVRVEVEPGKWQDLRLAVWLQRNPRAGLIEVFRLLLRTEVPHRGLTEMERSEET